MCFLMVIPGPGTETEDSRFESPLLFSLPAIQPLPEEQTSRCKTAS